MKRRRIIILQVILFLVLTLSQVAVYGQEAEDDTEEYKDTKVESKLDPKYRIISGRNYDIRLNEQSQFIYIMPINYKVEQESGIGTTTTENQLQENEIPDTLYLRHVGFSIIGLERQEEELYTSFFFQGILPSKCHKIKIETKKTEEAERLKINTLLFSGIDRKRICVTQGIPVEGTFISEKLVKGRPIILQINYQNFAEIIWENDEIQMNYGNQLWKVTKIKDIINYREIGREEKRKWIQGKEIKIEPRRETQTEKAPPREQEGE